MSRWWVLAVFAPILNLWVGYRCFACPPGYAYHKKLDGAGVALAILYWLVLLAGIWMLATAVFPHFGTIENTQIPQQLRAAIRSARIPGVWPR